jgi:hypothetical protein
LLTKSNAKAYAVLAIIIDHLEEEAAGRSVLESHFNGREEGFVVRMGYTANHKAVFAAHCNTDDIVVYVGRAGDFSMQGTTTTDTMYGTSRSFYCEEYLAAAVHIIDHLQSLDPNPFQVGL